MSSSLLRRLSYLLRFRKHATDLEEEMALHRELAGAAAFGNATLAREDARAVWLAPWIESVGQDIRYAVRSLRRQPAFSACVIAIVALGTGAATGVFGLLDGLVMRRLPVDRPDGLVWFMNPSFSYPIFADVERRLTVFEGLFGWNMDRAYVDWAGAGGDLVPADLVEATGGFFPTLRVPAAAGRLFGPGDTHAAVLSHAAWARHYGAEGGAIGRTIRIGTVPYTIVGVAPAGFFGVAPGLAPEIFVPINGRHPESAFLSPSSSWLHMMGRLEDGVTRDQANAALQAVWPSVLQLTVSPGMAPERRAMFLGRRTALEPGGTGFSRVRNQFGEPLRLLMALVGLLLAIACASVSNLLLARGVARRRELAIRMAIGASRARVFRQVMTEALVLTVTGAAIGLLFSGWSGATLVALLRTNGNPLALETSPGWRAIGFVAVLAIAVSILSAWLPTLRAVRGSAGALKEAAQPGTALFRRWSMGKVLVAIQVGLALVLVAGAALFGRSLLRILAQGSGLESRQLLIVSPDGVAAGLDAAALDRFHLALVDRLRTVAGVESAALAWKPPISYPGGSWTQTIAVDGGRPILSDTASVYFNSVSPGYFATVGMALRRGRDLSERDTAAAPAVTVINETLARRYFPAADPIGHRISIGLAPALGNVEIVGVVQDAPYRMLQEPQRSIAYLACDQHAALRSGSNRNLVAVARIASTSVARAAAEQARSVDANVPLRVETVADRIRESTVNERVLAALAAGLSGIALILASAGLYGLLAYAVNGHGKEIGLRLALGACPSSVLWMVQRESLALAAAGIVAGLAAALALGRFVRSQLFEVTPADPLALAAASAIMLAVAAAAAYLPARRAAAVDPLVALKGDG